MQAARIDQRLRAWELARDSARLGARIRTIHHLTGLRPRDLLYMLFSTHTSPPRGRAPDTREWYHNANLLYRIEASIVIANFQTQFGLDWGAMTALAILYSVPVIALTLLLQKHIVAGMTLGAVKG